MGHFDGFDLYLLHKTYFLLNCNLACERRYRQQAILSWKDIGQKF